MTFEGPINIDKHIGIYIDLRLTPYPDYGDELIKAYASGFVDGLPFGSSDGLQWRAMKAREEYPEAEVVEVRVALADGNHDFTWAEFETWIGRRP